MVISVKEINENDFDEKVKKSKLSLVDIWAPWCGPCKQLGPILDEVSSETLGVVEIFKMNADENLEFCKNMNVRNIPTMLVFKEGEVVDRMTGLKSKKEILDILSNHRSQ